MSAADRFAPPAAQQFGFPPVDVSPLYVPTVDFVVITVAQEDRIRPRDQKLIPTIAVTFSVPGLPGQFVIRIDNYAFTHADPVAYVHERSYLIRSLYALPDKLPPYERVQQAAGGPIATLTSVTPTTEGGQDAVAWTGAVNPQGLDAVATFDVLHLPDNEVYYSSDPIPVAATDASVPLNGTLAGIAAGSYLGRLEASNANGVGVASTLPFTIP